MRQVDSAWFNIFEQHDLRNIAAHGMRDLNSNMASYFNFSRIPGPLGARTAYLLELLVPHMHCRLGECLCQRKSGSRHPLYTLRS